MKTTKDRLKEYLKYSGLSQRKFEIAVGVSNGYVNNLKSSPSSDVMQKIFCAYPELNTTWLLTGQGSMLNGGNAEVQTEIADSHEFVNKVPLLPLDAIAGSLNDFVGSVNKYECEQTINPIEGADFAITVSGESMTPEYPNGSRIFIKRIKESAFIDWGRVYVLDTCNGVVVKRLVPSDKDTENYVRCLSINPDPMYAPFEVAWEDVYGVYRVLLCMSIK